MQAHHSFEELRRSFESPERGTSASPAPPPAPLSSLPGQQVRDLRASFEHLLIPSSSPTGPRAPARSASLGKADLAER